MEHNGHKSLAVHRRTLPGNRHKPIPERQHGLAGNLGQPDILAPHLGGKPIVQVQYPPFHRHLVMQLFAGALGKLVIPAKAEHLHDRFFVNVAGDVVEGPAVTGLKFR